MTTSAARSRVELALAEPTPSEVARTTRLIATPGQVTLTTPGEGPRGWRVPDDVVSYTIHTDTRHNVPPYLLVLLDAVGSPVASFPLRDWVPTGELVQHDLFIQAEVPRRFGSRLPWPLDSLAATAGLSPYRGDFLDDNAVGRVIQQWRARTTADIWVFLFAMFAPVLLMLSAILIVVGLALFDARHATADVLGVLASAFLASTSAIPLFRLVHIWHRGRARAPRDAPENARMLRPSPARPVSRAFAASSWLAVAPSGLVLRRCDGEEITFPAVGPTAITRWVITAEDGVPGYLDLFADREHLVRMSWPDWFPDNAPEHLTQALGVRAEPAAEAPDLAGFAHRVDNTCSAGETGLMFILPAMFTCFIAFLFARTDSAIPANLLRSGAIGTALLMLGAPWISGRFQRDRQPPVSCQAIR